MSRPLAVDLFCKAGGASMGLYRAGFDVIGVDIEEQPNYPFPFIRHDALTFPLDGADFVWASPPCQKFTTLRTVWNHKNDHPDMIEPIRKRLNQFGIPYVIENVPGAPLIDPIKLCGTMFDLGVEVYDGWRELRRHRMFESSFDLSSRECVHKGATIGVYGDHARDRRRKPGVRDRGIDFPDCKKLALGQLALGIDWMNWKELSQAIPPAYAQYIGEQAIATIRSTDYVPSPSSCSVISAPVPVPIPSGHGSR